MKKLSIVLLSLLLCTGGITQTESDTATEKWYYTTAASTVLTRKCGLNGQLSPDKAAWGKLHLEQLLKSVRYDAARMAAMEEKLDKAGVLPSLCNWVAVGIAEAQLKEQRAQPPAAVVQATPPVIVQPWMNTPRTTNCSTYFGQTHCTSF
jgi:hypothetical protein